MIDLDMTVDNSMLSFPNMSASSRQILKSVVKKNASGKKLIIPYETQKQRKSIVEDQCDVVCEEDELMNQLIE